MPTIVDKKVTFNGGEELPEVGSPSYISAQKGVVLPKGPSIISTNGVRREINNYSKTLDGYMRNGNPTYVNPNQRPSGLVVENVPTPKTTPPPVADVAAPGYTDQYTQLLDQMSTRSDDATKMLIATVNANRANRGTEVEQAFDKYARGLETLGVQSGQLQATPEIIKGQLLQAKNDKLEKLRELDSEEVKAIADANLARDEKDYALLKDRMEYISQLKKDKLDALKSVQDDERFYMEKAEYLGDSLYDELSNLSADKKEAAILALSQQTGIPAAYIVAAVASTRQDRIKASSSTTKLGKPALTEKLVFAPADRNWQLELTQVGLDENSLKAIDRLINDEGYTLKQLAQNDYITLDQFDYLTEFIQDRTDEGGSTAALQAWAESS